MAVDLMISPKLHYRDRTIIILSGAHILWSLFAWARAYPVRGVRDKVLTC